MCIGILKTTESSRNKTIDDMFNQFLYDRHKEILRKQAHKKIDMLIDDFYTFPPHIRTKEHLKKYLKSNV